MSWFRSAVTKAVEVSGKNSLTRTVRSYADTVVQQAGQAVAEGAKIFQDRIGVRNFQSFKLTVKRLEELSVSCKGVERIQLLRRWLVALKEIERLSGGSLEKETYSEQNVSSDSKDSPRKPSMVLYYDADIGGEPMNFRDVFLSSQALEGIVLSMILEAPDDEEVSLLSEIFGVCLTGGKEVHNAVLSSLQDLGKAFSCYQDEVLIKREELLQLAQNAVSGLKLNADYARIDVEASLLKQKLDGMKASQMPSSEEDKEKTSGKTTTTTEALKEAMEEVQLCSKLESLLVKKKSLSSGDTPESHSEKVDKLKVLSESLASSTVKAENRISEERLQKEEALKFRVAKSSEVSEIEKELAAEVSSLEKQKDELEAELKKVNISLTAARARLRNTREEREQFDEASNQIVAHLKTKEDELSSSAASCRIEADVVNTWITFLEDTWALQSSYTEQKDKQAKDELEKSGEYFVHLLIQHLSAYKGELGPYINHIRNSKEKLKNSTEGTSLMSPTVDGVNPNPRKHLEEDYVESEAKIIVTLGVVDEMKKQFNVQQENTSRKEDCRVKELFDWIEKLKEEFESIERPSLEIDISIPRVETPSGVPKSPSLPLSHSVETSTPKNNEPPEVALINAEQSLPATKMVKLDSDLSKASRNPSTEEIGDWEFD